MITEPDVTFTDYLLTLECTVFAYIIGRHGKPGSEYRFWFMLFFVSLALASLAGGTVHGFFLDTTTLGYKIFWPFSLICIGMGAFTGWNIAGIILLPLKRQFILTISEIILIVYCGFVLLITQAFLTAILHFLPAALFLLAAFFILYRRERERTIMFGVWGFILTLFAPIFQQAKISIHEIYFNHNALYHAIQAVAFYLIFRAARTLSNQKVKGDHL